MFIDNIQQRLSHRLSGTGGYCSGNYASGKGKRGSRTDESQRGRNQFHHFQEIDLLYDKGNTGNIYLSFELRYPKSTETGRIVCERSAKGHDTFYA